MTLTAETVIPTRARRGVSRLIFALAVITYLDRLCISAAAPAIMREFDFSPSQMGYVFSAFTLAYAVFEVPSGWLGDRYGARLALTRIVLWWSAFTALTGAAIGFWSLLAVRFLFGAGEAGAFPNIARSVSRWFPEAEQGRSLSVAFIGLAVGAAVSTPLVFGLVAWAGWRWAFVIFGAAGVAWAVAWYRRFRDRPEDHPAVNEAELRLIRAGRAEGGDAPPVPWKRLLGSANLAFVCGMYFAYGYGLYFYITWLPTYLLKARGFSPAYAGLLASLPWAVSVAGFWFGGWVTDYLARRTRSLKLARCGVGAAGYAGSALALPLVARIEADVPAALLLAAAFCLQTVTISAAWAVCLDVGRRYAGVVTGFMNTVGNLGGALAPLVVGYSVERLGSWTLPFDVMAGVFAVGGVMWLLVNPNRSVA